MVVSTGLEPVTSPMSRERATNCAKRRYVKYCKKLSTYPRIDKNFKTVLALRSGVLYLNVMYLQSLWPYLLTGLTVSVVHAALPTHWLPFVLAGRSQKWTLQKTVMILLIAGIGHILMTMLIGAGLVWLGLSFIKEHHHALVYVSAFVVFAFGCYHLIEHFRGHKHSHCDHNNPHHHDFNKSSKDGWAILSLLALLTFSPCEAFLPVYISSWQTGWMGFLILSLVLAIGTLSSMFVLTSLTYVGLKKMNLNWLEDHEKIINGVALVILSIVIFWVEKNHTY